MAESETNQDKGGGLKSLLGELPFDRLKDEAQRGFSSLSQRAVDSAGSRIGDLTSKLTDVSEGGSITKSAAKGAVEDDSTTKGAVKGGLSGVKDKVKDKLGGGGSDGGGKAVKSTNIIEEIDVGVPVSVAYNQWTQFQDYSNFMKKVEDVDQQEEAKLNFKAQVFWSHRKWEATIIEQVPDERIVWRSKGEKGHVDGSVSFHELAPRLTRIVVVMEYYPQGFMERTGNLWRAQGRRARLELKHFRRHLMMLTQEELDEIEGWRGEIRDKEVERDHDEVVAEEEEQQESSDEESGEGYDEGEGEPEDEYEEEESEGEPEDEYEEEGDGEPEDEYEEEEPEDEYEEEAEGEPEDEYEEGEGEPEGEDEEGEPDEEYDEEAEYEEEPEGEEAEGEEPEGEPEDEYEEEPEQEEEPAPRRRRRR